MFVFELNDSCVTFSFQTNYELAACHFLPLIFDYLKGENETAITYFNFFFVQAYTFEFKVSDSCVTLSLDQMKYVLTSCIFSH